MVESDGNLIVGLRELIRMSHNQLTPMVDAYANVTDSLQSVWVDPVHFVPSEISSVDLCSKWNDAFNEYLSLLAKTQENLGEIQATFIGVVNSYIENDEGNANALDAAIDDWHENERTEFSSEDEVPKPNENGTYEVPDHPDPVTPTED